MAEKSIFDNLNDIFHNKTNWTEYSDIEKKRFNPYMINRWISMSMDYIGIVNYLQQFTIGLLDNKLVYALYKDILPKTKFYSKYIKGNKSEEESTNRQLVEFLCETFHWNEDECHQNLKMIPATVVIETLKEYGYSESEIKKFKIK